MSEQKLKEIAERHADRIGTYAVCTAPVELVMNAINEAIAADRAAVGGRDCGCAHYWNCPLMKPVGEKPVLRPVKPSGQPVADRAARAEPVECGECGGTGDVSGEYPGVTCPMCNGHGHAAPPAAPVVPEGMALVPLELTAENGAKCALMGEFHVRLEHRCGECAEIGDSDDCLECGGVGVVVERVSVGWSVIKAIWAAGVAHFAAATAPSQEPTT